MCFIAAACTGRNVVTKGPDGDAEVELDFAKALDDGDVATELVRCAAAGEGGGLVAKADALLLVPSSSTRSRCGTRTPN